MPEEKVNSSFGCFKVSLKSDKNICIKMEFYLKWTPDARRGKGLGETP